MWRFIIALILIVGLWYGYATYYQEHVVEANTKSNGFIRYGKETVAALEANGFVTLEGTTIRNTLFVNGSLDATNAQIGALHVNGNATLLGSTINGKSQVNGFLSATNTTFRSELIVSGQSVTFAGCTFNGTVIVKKPAWAFGSQVIELTEKSLCKGQIIFEGGNGKVILSKTSQILGPIKGAEVEKQ